ncbi:hypothetical protein RND71_034254 [Anisodus tanguticus]|uniref:Cytochrome b561 domain-containing protein n=1 Tax=Anisodus tanguticus TaxID=243964 RepID=A0AAE1R996_9SOLA|nr:hypothetical protein RND71_034254 [Anisodus tanguticus]
METHIQKFLNKLSFTSITIATLTLLLLVYLKTPLTCINPNPKPHHKFPKSTCNITHRTHTTINKHNRRIWSTKAWTRTVHSFTLQFQSLQAQNLFSNNSRILIVSAGAGHSVMALNNMGVKYVSGVEVVESPPLVSRADPHNLPFFNKVFDFGLSPYLERALFPARYVGEMERTVRDGGACVVAVEACGGEDVEEVVKLFKKSKLLEVKNVTLGGERRTNIVMQVVKSKIKIVHGIINGVSWGMMMPLGVVFARLRYLPLPEYPALWFNLHIYCQTIAFFLGIAGGGLKIFLGRQSSGGGVKHTSHRFIGGALLGLVNYKS